MRWKRISNFITVIILSGALVVTTLLNMIGPLHMNATGGMAQPDNLTIYSFLYLLGALALLWITYFILRHKPEILFFTLIISGIFLIIGENFLWAWMG
jgi:hypothetical protein